MSKNQIGLNKEKSRELAEGLNELLADYMIFYQNTRGFHWNIKGEKFFELHLKFEELYNDLIVKVDEIAERILTLGVTPLHTFADYKKQAKVDVVKDVSDARGTVQAVLDAFKVIIVKQRELLNISGELEDEGTNALMSDYIREQEKTVWMLSAWLG